MDQLRPYLRTQIITLILFLVLKLIRPSILAASAPGFIDTLFLSAPNFCEAIIGSMTIVMIGVLIRNRLGSGLSDIRLYIGSIALTGVYVFSQEMRFHNIGGNNVYDPNDMIASFLGLGVAVLILLSVRPPHGNQAS